MTPVERVRRARRLLAGTVAAVALLWAATVGLAVLALGALAARVAPLPFVARVALLPLAVVAALAGAAVVLWRGRAVRSVGRVALWVEERDPSLRYALVTAIEPAVLPMDRYAELHAAAAAAQIETMVRGTVVRAVGVALLAAALTGAVVAGVHPGTLLRGAGEDLLRGTGLLAARAPLGNRLATLTARVEPPAYARMAASTIDEPSNVAALVGSRVTIGGRGPASGVTSLAGTDTLAARDDDGGWSIATRMPTEPVVMTLRDRGYRRLVTLEPRPDSAPTVKLQLPASDTTYQTVPRGTLVIDARATDDVGLAFGYVEYLLSTGSEESFDTKLVTSRRIAFANSRAAALHEVVRFDTLKLTPGSVLHIRAVAYDYNDVTGPGKGVSETRTLRVAEPLDSTSINAAPPLPIDTLWVSQRLLNMRTDTLIRDRRRLQRAEFVGRSSGYSNTQEGIRRRVLNVIGLLEADGVGGAFETETSTKLREVADLMLTARTDLGIALPDTAMPYMKRILKILDEIRLANRYYIRGLVKPVAVNVERVRATGKDPAHPTTRTPRAVLADPTAALVARIDAAVAVGAVSPAAAAESVTFIRAKALTDAPSAAPALQSAIAAIQRGVPVSEAVAPARRALRQRAHVVSGAPEWGGVSP